MRDSIGLVYARWGSRRAAAVGALVVTGTTSFRTGHRDAAGAHTAPAGRERGLRERQPEHAHGGFANVSLLGKHRCYSCAVERELRSGSEPRFSNSCGRRVILGRVRNPEARRLARFLTQDRLQQTRIDAESAMRL